MKREIELWDHAGTILKALEKGVLLTTRSNDEANTMTISWGSIGIEWGVPIFTAYVRENRHTKKLLDENPEFTVNIPLDNTCRKALGFCGTKSGRDIDKISACGLTPIEPNVVDVPAIREFPLTLECRVVYRQAQDPRAVSEKNEKKFYPQDVASEYHGANRDHHTAYYGEIVSAYIIEDDEESSL